MEALASKGPGGERCRLDERRLQRLRAGLERGPAAHGYVEDQRWTPVRIADLIAVLFHVRHTLRGVSCLLHRLGWSPQIPAQRAVERGEGVITSWVVEEWPAIEGGARPGRPAVLGRRVRAEPEAAPGPPGRGSLPRRRPAASRRPVCRCRPRARPGSFVTTSTVGGCVAAPRAPRPWARSRPEAQEPATFVSAVQPVARIHSTRSRVAGSIERAAAGSDLL
ncbi:winged helix-turn-helix domain-containing protein [Streptosporangium sp. NPDC020072]|uniref:winged helix-turn-helix domain-containing protein n=1 Tax=Streptosporangium sp. NPDC020072 TaxID=3154788 RepID=UPI00341644CB